MVNTPQFINNGGLVPAADYNEWLKELRLRFKQAQIKASVKVNRELIGFYWTLGRDIVASDAEKHWGSGILNQLSLDLRDAFPGQNGFSVTNLKYMKRWYAFYAKEKDGLPVPIPEKFLLVPWRHHVEIITKCKDVREALFYIDKTIESNWSRSALEYNIEAGLFSRQGSAVTNFSTQLPAVQGNLAEEVLKDPYKLDFISLREGYDEIDLEDALARNITRFLLELGQGFAYVGRQMELRMPGGQSFYPDMIFYHTRLKCYVVVELKVVQFIPEFAGKLNFYVTAVDHLLKREDDNPSIGLLICKSKDDTVVRWSFEDVNKPIGVSTYQLQEIVNRTIDNKAIEGEKEKERKES